MRNYCREMICRVRSEQLPLQSCEGNRRRQTHRAAGGSDRTRRRVPAETRDPPEENLNLSHGEHFSPHQCQGPVPPQIIAMLRLKTFREQMRRAAEVELHDPAVCSVCQQQQASLALKTFIRRKKTQLQFQTLKGRLNTHLRLDTFEGVGAKSPKALRCPSLDLGGTT